ncbi:MAG: nuclear transport factor 2 family protein [Arenimonas sp.]
MKKPLVLTFVLLLSSLQTAHAQVTENSSLFRQIMELDSRIFEQGFNECKPGIFEKYTADDLEFFHDKGGTQNRTEFLQATKQNICANSNGKPIRTLIAGNSKVFPLENNGVLYGAIQQGVHKFHTKGSNPALDGYTVAKFTHVWLLRNGQWKLKTALSFDHQHIDGKTANTIPIKKAVKQPVKLFQLTITSLSWSLYFQDQRN